MSKLIRKIEKLTALSQSPNEAEAAAAAAKVAELMMLHGIEAGELNLSQDEGCEGEFFAGTGRMLKWKQVLLEGVCELNGLDFFIARRYDTNNQKSETGFRLFGRKASLIGAQLTYEYLENAVDCLTKRKASRRGARYAQSFRYGCSLNLYHRMVTLRREMEAFGIQSEAGTSTALAVKSQYEHDKEITDKMLEAMKLGAASKSKANLDGFAIDAGRSAANSISLSKQIETGREVMPALEGAL